MSNESTTYYVNFLTTLLRSVRGMALGEEAANKVYNGLKTGIIAKSSGKQKLICTRMYSLSELGQELIGHLDFSTTQVEGTEYQMLSGKVITKEIKNLHAKALLDKKLFEKAVKDPSNRELIGAAVVMNMAALQKDGSYKSCNSLVLRQKDLEYCLTFVAVMREAETADELLKEVNRDLLSMEKLTMISGIKSRS